jgi:hypothetical protein
VSNQNNKSIVVNTSERAVSGDINRAQAFLAAALGDDERELYDTSLGNDDTDAAGLHVANAVIGAPLSGTVIGGLLVQPLLGATQLNLLVSPGILAAFNPAGAQNPDSSVMDRIADAGVSIVGALAMTANAAGSTRFDWIECQPVLTVIETDSRDIFNPITGLFSAATVNKVEQQTLQYRVRLGTPGAGPPAFATGWFPLAGASVPAGAAGNDAITFWDLRNLAATRIFRSYNLTLRKPRTSDIDLMADGVAHGGHVILTGRCDVTPSNLPDGVAGALHRVGGQVRRGTPGADLPFGTDGVDLQDMSNWATDVNNPGTNYIYLLTPFGLPWSRYTDATSGARQPRSPRGILVVSGTAPNAFGSPSAPVPFPAVWGLGANEPFGVCIGCWNPGQGNGSFLTRSGRSANWTFGADIPFNAASITSLSATVKRSNFTLTPGTTHPAHARFVNATLLYTLLIPATSIVGYKSTLKLANAAGTDWGDVPIGDGDSGIFNNTTGAPVGIPFSVTVRVPLVDPYPASVALVQTILGFVTFTGSVTASVSAATMTVNGFDT